jgi:hypothetical protein
MDEIARFYFYAAGIEWLWHLYGVVGEVIVFLSRSRYR